MKVYVLSEAGAVEYLKRRVLRWFYFDDPPEQGASKETFLAAFGKEPGAEQLWDWLTDTGLIEEK